MRKIVMLLIGTVLVALLAGCGAGDDQDEGPSQQAEQPADSSSEDAGAASESASNQEMEGAGDENSSSQSEFTTVSSIDMELSWRVIGDSLEVKVSGPTTGWVAVGFDPSRMMKDANILIGYVNGSTTVVTDQFGVTATSHRLDEEVGGGNHVTVLGGSESGGVTELHFSVPLDSGDERDRVLAPGGEYRVILAYGEDGADDVESYHKNRSGLTITL